MRKLTYSILFIVFAFMQSCIPAKDIIYLQKKENSDSGTTISEVPQKPYRLQINDVLSINIKTNEPALGAIFNTTSKQSISNDATGLYFEGFTIDAHGNIRIPILGEINAIGYTTEELRTKIEKQLLDEYFKKDANLFVTVKMGGFKYTINGEVGNTGTKYLFQDHVNILEAIANSGDITLTGDRKAVTIIRQTPTGTEMHDIDLTDIKVLQSPYYQLQPNDYIYVKPLKQKTWGTGKTGVESMATIVSVISLLTTALLLFKIK